MMHVPRRSTRSPRCGIAGAGQTMDSVWTPAVQSRSDHTQALIRTSGIAAAPENRTCDSPAPSGQMYQVHWLS
jgi:hypothetical protein